MLDWNAAWVEAAQTAPIGVAGPGGTPPGQPGQPPAGPGFVALPPAVQDDEDHFNHRR